LIVYGSRYGATARTSEEISKNLQQEKLDVRLINLKEENVTDITDYELVIVGSGIKIGKWTKEPEIFLKKFQKELTKKKVALFVCCGSAQPLNKEEKEPEVIENYKRKYLQEKAIKYNLQPIALGFFGGVYNFNKVSWLFRKFMAGVKPKLEEAGFKETQPGVYDLRDLNVIRDWAKGVANLVQS
jgi:menaquinone-dependent protoporphyrinogen oxidase